MGVLVGLSLMSLVSLVLFLTFDMGVGTHASETNTATTSGTVAGTGTNPTPSQPVDIRLRAVDHVRGDINASITLVEYADFQCPYCQKIAPTLLQILEQYEGQVKLVYRHFPLSSIHPMAQKSAEASECVASLAGESKFWEYHDLLFQNQLQLSFDNLKQWAKEVGVDSSKFSSCLDDGEFAQKVQTDFAEGSQFGVNGTPATFVNGKLIFGALPLESFKQVIDSLL